MQLFKRVWTALIYCTNRWMHFPTDLSGLPQQPILDQSEVGLDVQRPHYPIFKPPGGRLEGPGSDFVCNYTKMVGWYECSTPTNRECWLRHPDGREFNIRTDYENKAPNGTDRYYTYVVTDGLINADGKNFTAAKLFNNSFPGPWVQACWGDVSTEHSPRCYSMLAKVRSHGHS